AENPENHPNLLYSFYKNFAFTVTLFWFGWFSGFSATSMYESWYISLFNCIFTIAPIVVYGLGDQELRPERYGRLPATYALGRLGREATPWTFLIWIIDGIWTSFACFFSGLLMLEDCISYDGKTEDMWFFGNMICSGAILVVTLKILLESNFFTWIHALVAGLSYIAWFIVALIINTGILRDNMYGAFYRDLMSPTFWLYLIIVPAIVIVPPYTLKYIFRVFKPSVDHVIRERELVLLKEEQQDDDVEEEIDQLAYGEKVEEEPSLQSNANEAFREDVQKEQKEQGIYGQVDENGQRVKVPELKKSELLQQQQQQQQYQSSQSQLQSKDVQQEKKQALNINRVDTISPPLMSGDRKSAFGTARKSERDTMKKPFVRQQSRAEADFAQFTKHWVV
ncbi:MAG: putative P-type ATPase, partial [Streblomastix strix]